MSACTNCQLPIETQKESDKLCGPCKNMNKKEMSIHLTPIDDNDHELLLAWRSNPKIFQHFREQNEPIDWEDHLSWFESRGSDRYDFMIYYDCRRVGVINIDENNMVGIYIGDFSAHGQGIATEALSWLCNRFEHRSPLFAEIHEDNANSKKLFRRCGFRQVDQDEKWIEYVYHS